MNIFGGFKETMDAADINKEGRPEIRQEARFRFEQIMGDDNLAEEARTENREIMSFNKARDRFEELLKRDTTTSHMCENTGLPNTSKLIEVSLKGDISHEPNGKYKVGEDIYETDETGITYKKNGELLPNMEYTINGSTYRTDEMGNKVSCDANPEISEDGKRNISEQRESGGEDRKEGDQGGHIVARILGGAEGEENLVPMRGTINQGDYKKMELEIKKALEDGKKASLHIDLEYEGDSSRPTEIIAIYTIDGQKTHILFDNEENSTRLMDSLEDVISGEDFAGLRDEIEDMKNDGHPASITSVKTELDENGNVLKAVAGILDESTGIKSYRIFEVH